MTVYYQDGALSLYVGDCRSVLRGLPAESVQTCITSPPYWSLRDYGVEPSIWGGPSGEGCEHEWVEERWYVNGGGSTGVAGGPS